MQAFVYASAFERGYTASTTITDAPVVYEEGEGQETKKWKPGNFENRFQGDVTFRTALIKSLNILILSSKFLPPKLFNNL